MGAIGGCVEPVVVTEHHSSGAPCAGLTALERVEAELDRRERARALLLATADGAIGSKHIICTYSDIAKRSVYPTRVAEAVVGLASAGVPAQSAAASGVSTIYSNVTQVPTPTSTSPSSEGLAPEYHTYHTYRNKLSVHESQDMHIGKSGVGVGGFRGKGVGKGSHDVFICKLGVGVGGLRTSGIGGLGSLGVGGV